MNTLKETARLYSQGQVELAVPDCALGEPVTDRWRLKARVRTLDSLLGFWGDKSNQTTNWAEPCCNTEVSE